MLRATLITKSDRRRIVYPDVLSIGCKDGNELIVTYRENEQILTDNYLRTDIFRYTTAIVSDEMSAPVEEEVDNDASGHI